MGKQYIASNIMFDKRLQGVDEDGGDVDGDEDDEDTDGALTGGGWRKTLYALYTNLSFVREKWTKIGYLPNCSVVLDCPLVKYPPGALA
jgi:hypothetical protein